MSEVLTGKMSPSQEMARLLIQALELDETTREELDSITESTYTSSFVDGQLRLSHQGQQES